MRCGLYGKLPSKRDFIASGAPRAFLRLWEPWIDQGLAAGRARAGERGGERSGEHGGEDEWTKAFNCAPIWRFWLGPALCGEAFAGAFMPSVDALGRMYPLTLIGSASGEDKLDPPDVDPRDLWFAGVERLLLDALDPDEIFEDILARLKNLRADPAAERGNALACAFADMRAERPDTAPDEASFWWTIGGLDWPPLALMQAGMPPPSAFADMLNRPAQDIRAPRDGDLQTAAQSG